MRLAVISFVHIAGERGASSDLKRVGVLTLSRNPKGMAALFYPSKSPSLS